MPGKKFKNNAKENNRELREKTDTEEYALVKKVLGGGNFIVIPDSSLTEITASVRGAFTKGAKKKDNYVEKDKIVLIERKDYQTKDSATIVHVYNSTEERELKKRKLITFIQENTNNKIDEDSDIGFDFNDI